MRAHTSGGGAESEGFSRWRLSHSGSIPFGSICVVVVSSSPLPSLPCLPPSSFPFILPNNQVSPSLPPVRSLWVTFYFPKVSMSSLGWWLHSVISTQPLGHIWLPLSHCASETHFPPSYLGDFRLALSSISKGPASHSQSHTLFIVLVVFAANYQHFAYLFVTLLFASFSRRQSPGVQDPICLFSQVSRMVPGT